MLLFRVKDFSSPRLNLISDEIIRFLVANPRCCHPVLFSPLKRFITVLSICMYILNNKLGTSFVADFLFYGVIPILH